MATQKARGADLWFVTAEGAGSCVTSGGSDVTFYYTDRREMISVSV